MPNKAAGVSKLFLSLTAAFTKVYEEEALLIASATMLSKRLIKEQLNKKLAATIGPLMDKYFTESIAASNVIVKRDVAALANNFNLPVKYNKDLLLKINGESVFTGYFDTKYKSAFTKSEIDKLKKVILQAKYNDWPEERLRTEVLNTIKVTKNRALVIARNESRRLTGAATEIYFQNPKVKKEYNKFCVVVNDGKSRHTAYGGWADEDGLFHGSNGSYKFPPYDFGCRCIVEIRKRPINSSNEDNK